MAIPWKLVVLAVVVRKHPTFGVQIHTQTRNVIDKDYDWLYDDTFETVGETVQEGEAISDALIRGCREELGAPDTPFIILGEAGERFSTRQGEDEVETAKPFCFVQQLFVDGKPAPQPWAGPVFVVKVPSEFEPSLNEKGEVSEHQWWNPRDLLWELHNHPEKFMGLHFPALLGVCEALCENKLRV